MFVVGRNSCLIQIAAVHGDSTFSRYVTPLQPISDGAKDVTGICYNADSNEMTHSGVKVQHFHPVNILLDFIEFIKGVRTKVVLVAHNNKAFDSCVLYKQLKLHNLWSSFCKFTVGFCDTLPFFKLIYPEAVNHKQVTLAKEILGEEYVAHNAVEDCAMLKKLVLKTCKESILAERFFFSVQQMTSHGVEARPESVEWLFKNNIISKAISKKITDSGLSYDHLKLAFERNGYDGLYYLLSEADSNTGKPRVTKNHSVVKKVVNHFSMPQ